MASARHCIATLLCLLAATTVAADDFTIGVVSPQKGPYAVLGTQIDAGAGIGAALHGNRVVRVPDGCEAADGAEIARQLIEAKAQVATGFLCTESLEAALPALKEAGIPAIALGVRSDILMEDALKNGWPLFRLGPSQAAEVQKLASVIGTVWSAEPFALVDDGAIGNHDLVERLRVALEESGVKPVLMDTLRPGQDQQLTLVRHLSSAGVLRVFVAADRDDIAVLARDLIEQAAPISVLAGSTIETTPEAIPLPAGVQGLVVKDPAQDPANADLVKDMRVKGVEPEGYVLPALAAQIVADQALAAAGSEGKPLIEVLTGRAFDTPVGPVRFTDRHELTENPFVIQQWNGKAFVAPPAQ
ncbi:ABC transporter substrate-binding protein [Gellertiella hungarica]|uniref:Branched-chain amino acid transport system substrate-binding protein n=1 Tax=Gellertiella hungarica TaxID=1572859 RepID=A0A7W6J4H5_9HYPH|nr:ABC transporter substrate-binding protein [Gellertiella hungarica]MBB4064654.1 branched-chain amino acid transport system substrate-binding protein [Gellertiella hungarica]